MYDRDHRRDWTSSKKFSVDMSETTLVEVSEGVLRGCQGANLDGEAFFSFLGIPYAKAPVGDLRFKAPVSAETWKGVRDATKEGNRCYQLDVFRGGYQGSEDCLNLNIFTKKLPTANHTDDLTPVMVWLHGGGFESGSNSPSQYGPEFLMLEDIVLVTINYRVGLLGFLSLQDTSLGVPGNAGLKDQCMALKWIRKNIARFGGDPGNVTIFGESAGAVSASFHVVSECSRGLFHRAILMSGCVLNPWACMEARRAVDLFREVGRDVGGEEEALGILRNMSVHEVLDFQLKYGEAIQAIEVKFGPVIEQPNVTAFIQKNPMELLNSGNFNKVPIIMGYCSEEGLLFEFYKAMKGEDKRKKIQRNELNLDEYVPKELKVDAGSEIHELVKDKLLKEYLSDESKFDVHALLSDFHFISPIVRYAEKHSALCEFPVYLYRMSVDAGLNVLKIMAGLPYPGACHGDIVGYLFKNSLIPGLSIGDIEDSCIRQFVKLWTNFGKFNHPTPDSTLGVHWKAIEGNCINFLDIGESLVTDSNPEEERMVIWKDILQLNSNSL